MIMNTFPKFLTLTLFAAAGVGVAVCVAMALPRPNRAEWAQASIDSQSTSATIAGQPRSQFVPPHGEYASQFPSDPSAQEAATTERIQEKAEAKVEAVPGLGDIGKAVLKEVLTQEAVESKQQKRRPIPRPPDAARNANSAPPSEEGEEEGEEGEDPGTEQQRTSSQLPSSFTVTKLPSEGDDRLSVHIQNKNLREVLDFLGEHGGLSILASANVQGVVSVSLTDVTIEQALAAILKSTGYVSRREGKFVYVGTAKDIQTMVQSIDRVETRVYRPNYVKAAELQPLIMPLLSPAGTATSGMPAVAVSPPSQIGIAADGTQTGGDSFAEGEVIVVRDYAAVLNEIDQVIAEIDKRPLQVAIEAMLLKVELKDSNTFGVDFNFLRDQQHVRLATGSPLADLAQLDFADGGLKFGFLDSSLGAFVTALQTIGDTNVIASPRLMCLNKHKAEILIGQQLGYVTKTLTQTTTAQTVEFLEVGTQLRLRPFISTDGLIRMEVHPELSTGTVEVSEGFTLPNKQVTQVTTNIMVRDGCTVVIGGLMQENLANTGSQVPLIGSAPGIGFLFRNRTGSQTRDEIIVLITPHIVYEPESCIEGDQAAAEFHRQHAVYKDEFVPLNSRYVGRKFFRLAQKAWANNDKRAAMRFINMSVHFDPQNRASINLRSDILANNHFGEHTGIVPLPAATPAEAVDGPEIAPWVLNDLEQGGEVDNGAPTRAIRARRHA